MMIINVDLKSEGLAAGSRTVEEDWKDWKRPAISRDNAKLFRKSTFDTVSNHPFNRSI
jgi:hypothetical protein